MVDHEPCDAQGLLALLRTICVANTALADVVCDLLVHQMQTHGIICPTNAILYALVRTVARGDNVFSHTCRNYYSVVFEDQTILHGQLVAHIIVRSRSVSDFCEGHPPRGTCMSFCRTQSLAMESRSTCSCLGDTDSPSVMSISANVTA